MAESDESTTGFTKSERAAMNARSRELAAEKRANKKKADGETAVLEAIAEMHGLDRELALKVHELVTATAPDLWPKTWYGMPAYSIDGKAVVVFFQGAEKFEARFASIGFNDVATLDDGDMWPTSYALVNMTKAVEKRIVDLVRKATGQS